MIISYSTLVYPNTETKLSELDKDNISLSPTKGILNSVNWVNSLEYKINFSNIENFQYISCIRVEKIAMNYRF